jgi:hypothetical protein
LTYYNFEVLVTLEIMKQTRKASSDSDLTKFLKSIGRNIRAAREKKQMTLEEVEAAGYPSWRHLQKVEAGQPFTMTTLYRVAKALKIKPSDLLNGY